MEIIKQIKKENDILNKRIKELKDEMQAKTRVFMLDAFTDFFEKYDKIVDNVFWTQYTPHFNDGEACEFSTNEVCIVMKYDLDEDGDYVDDFDEYEGSEIYTLDVLKSYEKELEKILEFKKDPKGVIAKYREDYIKQYARDPFATDNSYYGRSKTTEQKMSEWSPSYYEKEELEQKIGKAKDFLKFGGNLKKDFEELKSFIEAVDEDIMQSVYGDGVKVIIRAGGSDVEEYDHD